MSMIVVAYPRLRPTDFEWIQAYRKQNDPRYFHIIDPHFTLVFPVADVPAKDLCREVRVHLEPYNRFEFHSVSSPFGVVNGD